MAAFLRRHSLAFTSLLLVVLSCQLMSNSIENRALPRMGGALIHAVLSPVEKVHHEAVESLHYVWSRYIWLIHVGEERDALRERVEALEAQNSRFVEFENENLRLRQLLNYQATSGVQGVAASVVGRDPSNWAKTITVDRGSADGVKVGMPVVDGNAVVGQTIAVTKSSARVLLLTDNASAIDSLVQQSRAPGIAEGTLGRKLKLRYVLQEYKVNPGDRVIASGLDGVYPKGTLIGVVTAVETQTSGLFQRVEVEPSIDPNRLESVFIVTTPERHGSAEGDQGVDRAAQEGGRPPTPLER